VGGREDREVGGGGREIQISFLLSALVPETRVRWYAEFGLAEGSNSRPYRVPDPRELDR